MAKFLQSLFHLAVFVACGLFIFFYWSGIFPERMKSEPSNTGTEVQLRITGTREWRPEFKTTIALLRPEGDRFVYDLQKLGSREAVERLVASLQWIDGNTLVFANGPKDKTVTVSYTNGLWSLEEQFLNSDIGRKSK